MAELIPVRRYVDADNSCLFSSIAYLTDANYSEMSKYKYRQMIAETLLNDSSKYSDVFLGKNKFEYMEFIQDSSNWGGEIENKIFSDIFRVEIASIHIQDLKMNIYGSDMGYQYRIYMLYNGIHYDPIVMTPDLKLDNSCDIKMFNNNDNEVKTKFIDLAKTFQKQNDFVDLSNIPTLKCSDCEKVFSNQNKAAEHAQNVGHWNFEQI